METPIYVGTLPNAILHRFSSTFARISRRTTRVPLERTLESRILILPVSGRLFGGVRFDSRLLEIHSEMCPVFDILQHIFANPTQFCIGLLLSNCGKFKLLYHANEVAGIS